MSPNSADDTVGTLHTLGAGVGATGEFHLKDTVAAFHRMMTSAGAYAEYAVAPAHTVFMLRERSTLEGLGHAVRLCVLHVHSC